MRTFAPRREAPSRAGCPARIHGSDRLTRMLPARRPGPSGVVHPSMLGYPRAPGPGPRPLPLPPPGLRGAGVGGLDVGAAQLRPSPELTEVPGAGAHGAAVAVPQRPSALVDDTPAEGRRVHLRHSGRPAGARLLRARHEDAAGGPTGGRNHVGERAKDEVLLGVVPVLAEQRPVQSRPDDAVGVGRGRVVAHHPVEGPSRQLLADPDVLVAVLARWLAAVPEAQPREVAVGASRRPSQP